MSEYEKKSRRKVLLKPQTHTRYQVQRTPLQTKTRLGDKLLYVEIVWDHVRHCKTVSTTVICRAYLFLGPLGVSCPLRGRSPGSIGRRYLARVLAVAIVFDLTIQRDEGGSIVLVRIPSVPDKAMARRRQSTPFISILDACDDGGCTMFFF